MKTIALTHRSLLLVIAALLASLVVLSGCSQAQPATLPPPALRTIAPTETQTAPPSATPEPSATATTPVDTATPTPDYTPTITPTPTPDVRPLPEQWTQWPVVPTLSARALEIYRRGLDMGNNPRVFSRVGDCQSEPEVFLGIYDTPDRYYLSESRQYLKDTIAQFSSSFSRPNETVKQGFGVASVFSTLMADPKVCAAGENPLQCEFRLSKPSFVFISMGTNWCAGCSAKYEEYLRMIVDYAIQQGTVPIISTKADNIEGDNALNKAAARVAYEYDLPLWNFWSAVQYLPNGGLKEDDIYLTVEGWNERSYTGLLVLDSLWKATQE